MNIDPGVLKFFVALIIATLLIEAISRISEGAAWLLALIIILGLFLNNPVLIGFLNLGSKSLQEGLK